jgi:hypothetical protein
MTSNAPDYEMFTTRGKPGGVMRFLRGLTPGVPTAVPSGMSYPALSSVRGRVPFKVALRKIDGGVWACRLKDEDRD